MIDAEGYRANVGIIIINNRGKVFWAKRIRQRSWQFPQGGVDNNESILAAMYRELYEEVGLKPLDVEVLAATRPWLKYRLPSHMVRRAEITCIGQKQKWFLLRLISPESAICFNNTNDPEFDGWRWVDYWYPLSQVIPFKRHVYRRALEYFFPTVKPPKS
ncbi:MAG: RNA pyrophosphohydrolase [Gammaproteobacteria bacterium]|nr:RNA pyrophosphohydrolase [Gammaproteobacteria bacterium]